MKFRLLLLSCLILLSCKILRKKRSASSDPDVEFAPNQGDIMMLPLSDKECTPGTALSDLGSVKVWIDISGKKVQRSFDLSGISGNMSSPFVEGVYLETTAQEVNRQFLNIKNGQRFYACKREYPRLSLENAALAAFISSHTTIKFFRDLDTKISYEPIALHIQAKIADSNGMLYRDNAYHYGPSIWFIPQSEEFYRIMSDTFFWEEMAVGAHEAGHHLYDTVIFGSAALKAQGVEPIITHLRSNITLSQIQKELVALNEGTADLVSFYRWGAGQDPIGDLKFGDAVMVRNPQYGQTDLGKKKVLTPEIFRTFEYGLAENPMKHFDPHDVHAIGSIFAHHFDRLLKDEVGATDSNPKATERMDALMDITREFSKLDEIDIQSPGDVFVAYMNVAIEHFKRDNALTKFQCDVLKEGFPFERFC